MQVVCSPLNPPPPYFFLSDQKFCPSPSFFSGRAPTGNPQVLERRHRGGGGRGEGGGEGPLMSTLHKYACMACNASRFGFLL